jgi:hypothetical protein
MFYNHNLLKRGYTKEFVYYEMGRPCNGYIYTLEVAFRNNSVFTSHLSLLLWISQGFTPAFSIDGKCT